MAKQQNPNNFRDPKANLKEEIKTSVQLIVKNQEKLGLSYSEYFYVRYEIFQYYPMMKLGLKSDINHLI